MCHCRISSNPRFLSEEECSHCVDLIVCLCEFFFQFSAFQLLCLLSLGMSVGSLSHK